MGSEEASVETLAVLLAELAAVEVDRLDLSRRSLDLVVRRDYGLVVIDSCAGDSVASINELSRRLAIGRRRDCAVVVCRQPGPMNPAIEHLIRRLGARCVVRPFEADSFMAAVTAALGGGAVDPGVVNGPVVVAAS